MMKLLGIILCICGYYSASAQFHGIDSDWLQFPKSSATSSQPDLHGAVANNMVVKSDGTCLYFYVQGNQNKWIQSPDNGNTWLSPGNLHPSAVNALSIVSADINRSDEVFCVWKSGPFTLTVAGFNGVSWFNVSTINTTTSTGNDTISFSQITVDRQNRIHVMWQQGNHKSYSTGNLSSCWYAHSIDNGATFSVPYRISGMNVFHAAFPVADFGGTSSDTLLIAWRENINGGASPLGGIQFPSGWNWDVKAASSYNGGVSWNPPISIASGIDDEWDPNTVIDRNGVIHVFYHVYHDSTLPDYNANVLYNYSIDGGINWLSGPLQLSVTGIRSHLVKTAYDYINNFVWCTWKDERDMNGGNPRADIMVVPIQNNGVSSTIGSSEFICDHDTMEVALHNFKVGDDGLLRAVYNLAKDGGSGDTINYTQRLSLVSGFESIIENSDEIVLFPNPVNSELNIVDENKKYYNYSILDITGRLLKSEKLKESKIDVTWLGEGLYFLIAKGERCLSTKLFIKKSLP